MIFNGESFGVILNLLPLVSGRRFSINSTVDCHNRTSHHHINTVCSSELLVSDSLDYEDMPSNEIIVEVSDGTHTSVSNFTINLVDQNDPPENVTIQGSLTGRVKENANDELIGELVTSDEDASQSHVYALNDARFTIKGSKLYTSPEANFNYEEQQEFGIVVVSTDNGRPRLSVQRNLTVMVSDDIIMIMIIMLMMMIMIMIIMIIIMMIMIIIMMMMIIIIMMMIIMMMIILMMMILMMMIVMMMMIIMMMIMIMIILIIIMMIMIIMLMIIMIIMMIMMMMMMMMIIIMVMIIIMMMMIIMMMIMIVIVIMIIVHDNENDDDNVMMIMMIMIVKIRFRSRT